LAIRWSGVCYWPSSGPLKILNNNSGSIAAGSLTFVMGSSGGGKTTLLKLLSGRQARGRMSGEVEVAIPKLELNFCFGTQGAIKAVRERISYVNQLPR